MKTIRVKFNLLLLVVFASGATFGYKAYLEYKKIEQKQLELSDSLSLRNEIGQIHVEPVSWKRLTRKERRKAEAKFEKNKIEDIARLKKQRARLKDEKRRHTISNLIQALNNKNPRLYEIRIEEFDESERTFYKQSVRKISEYKQQFRYYVFVGLIMPFVGFFILFYYFNFKIAKPLDTLSRRMMEFLVDQYTFRFTNPPNNEIGDLERTFTALAQKVLNNIDELKALDHAKSEFVSIASHELRTPLTSIKGSLSILSTGIAGEMDDEAKELVAVADQETDRLVRLINDLLDIAKIESRSFTLKQNWVSLDDLINTSIDSLKGFATQAEVNFSYESKLDPIAVNIDKDRIQQVITNLCSNAIKYSPKDGTVVISCEFTHDKNIIVGITDSGPGISEENQALIFEKFRQATDPTSPLVKGTGLGLAISKALVEEHGGTVGVKSELGKGSTFYFNLMEWKLIENSDNDGLSEAA